MHYGRGYCDVHYGRWKRHGDPNKLLIRQPGRGQITSSYCLLRFDNKCIMEHRKIMQDHLGRELTSQEVVHHIDGNGLNNNISNLQLFPNNAEHMKHHAKLRRKKNEIHDNQKNHPFSA